MLYNLLKAELRMCRTTVQLQLVEDKLDDLLEIAIKRYLDDYIKQ